LDHLKKMASAVALVCASSVWAQPAQLPALHVAKDQISVSGLSSGAYMTVQMHFAYSGTFSRGAGVVAGGPLFCAEGDVKNALGRCMSASTPIPLEKLVKNAEAWAADGSLDPLSNLQSSPVYLFSGQNDKTVKPAVMKDLETFYRHFVTKAPVTLKADSPAGHAMVLDGDDESCPLSVSPYIVHCGMDLAGDILKQLYGPLAPRNEGPLKGSVVEFDQNEVGGQRTRAYAGWMADSGWAYVPQDCANGESCKLHVVFHGCHQNASQIGPQYILGTNYLKWADTNKMVVLFPQTRIMEYNGCWDWFGYTDKHDYATKLGVQMRAVKMMVDHLGSGKSLSALPAPAKVEAVPVASGQVRIRWQTVSGARGYAVYRNGGLVKNTVAPNLELTDSGLQSGTRYDWTVRAVDAQGRQGHHSSVASATTTGDKPQCFIASNPEHVQQGRAYSVPLPVKVGDVQIVQVYARGTNQFIGLSDEKNVTSLRTVPGLVAGKFEAGPCF
jgi:poly(3-hydroxybutyrate) depolymerase